MLFIKNIRTIVLLSICAICYGCNSSSQGNSSIQEKYPAEAYTSENFKIFFKKFQVDSVFQKSRIGFPLKYIIKGDEGGGDSTKFIPKTGMNYIKLFTANGTKAIVKKIPLSTTKVQIQFQIADIGFEKDFTFVQKNGNWYLVLIEDNSD